MVFLDYEYHSSDGVSSSNITISSLPRSNAIHYKTYVSQITISRVLIISSIISQVLVGVIQRRSCY